MKKWSAKEVSTPINLSTVQFHSKFHKKKQKNENGRTPGGSRTYDSVLVPRDEAPVPCRNPVSGLD
jgi:hypothetical protein